MSALAWWTMVRPQKWPFPWQWGKYPLAEPPLRLDGQHYPALPSRSPDAAAPVTGLPLPAAKLPKPVILVDLTDTVTVADADAGWRPRGGVAESSLKTSMPHALPGTSVAVTGPSLASRLQLLLAPPPRSLLPGPQSVLDWPGELMAFQEHGVGALIASNRLLLADDMGLGKTLQVIAALRILFVRREIESALIVAPASILDQWRRELHKWAPELRAIVIRGPVTDRAWQWAAPVHVTIVGYETLRSDVNAGAHSFPMLKTWDLVVADEAQRVKNRHATSDAVKGLQRRRSWALTGTPLENNEEELASILEFVDQDELVSESVTPPVRCSVSGTGSCSLDAKKAMSSRTFRPN